MPARSATAGRTPASDDARAAAATAARKQALAKARAALPKARSSAGPPTANPASTRAMPRPKHPSADADATADAERLTCALFVFARVTYAAGAQPAAYHFLIVSVPHRETA